MQIRIVLSAAISGLLFGAGLTVSGLIDPGRVLGFLDLAALAGKGTWDPTLGFVMAGGLATTIIGYALVRQRVKPLFGPRFEWPTRNDIDRRLIFGSAMFGAGWGLIGLCPGPAIAALASGLTPVLVFVAAMIAGMMAQRLLSPPPAWLGRGAAKLRQGKIQAPDGL